MSQEKSPQKSKALLIMTVLGLIAVSVIVWAMNRPSQSRMVTDAYQYYPENTAFYMELAPGDKLAGRFLQGLDNLRAMTKKDNAHSNMQIETLFKKDFEPAISFGVWMPSEGDATTSTQKEAPVLLVIPVKKGVTLETIAADLNIPSDEYSIIKVDDASVIQGKTNHPPVALHQDHLLAASSMEVLKQALQERKTPQTLLDNPLYKNNLGLLPQQRQGTVLMSNKALQQLPKDNGAADANLEMFVEFQKQLQAATPVMLASITVNQDQYLHFDAFTPVDLAKIENEAFRKDVKSLYQAQASFDLANMLPKDTVMFGGMAGLANYYDLYMNHFADTQGKQNMEQVAAQLKMMGLDLRKNLISLVDGKSGIGVVAKQGQPDVLVFFNNTPDTQKTLEQFGMIAAQMTGGRLTDKQMDADHSVKILESRQLPVKMAFSEVQKDTLVLGTQNGLEGMYSVQQKKAPSLKDNALYKELSAALPDKANGVFFVDLDQGAKMLDELAQKTPRRSLPGDELKFKQVLGGIEGIAGSNTVQGEKMLKGHLIIKLSDASAATE